MARSAVKTAEPKRKASTRAGQKLERGLKTRDAILDVAEQVINDEGLGVSLRRIMVVAGVNVTSINYHFGQRDQLIEAIVERRSNIINEERLALLAKAEQQPTPSVTEIVTAYYEPSFDPKRMHDTGWRNYLRILSRLSLESGKFYRDLMARHYDPMHANFLRALRKALPDLPEEELSWRYHAMQAIGVRAFPTPRPLNLSFRKYTANVTPEESLRNILPLIVHLYTAPPLSTLQDRHGFKK